MERLTNKHEADQQRRNYEKRLEQGYPRNIPEERFLRLAAYEDTGLEPEDFKKAFNEDASLKMTAQDLGTTPDRLHEWAKADKEDRLVALPCKVGDMVLEWGWKYSECHLGITPAYRPCSECEGCCAAECDSEKMAWLYTGKVVAFRVNGDCVLAQIHWDDKWDTSWYSIGKTVFLTREEAEAALAGERKDGEG